MHVETVDLLEEVIDANLLISHRICRLVIQVKEGFSISQAAQEHCEKVITLTSSN